MGGKLDKLPEGLTSTLLLSENIFMQKAYRKETEELLEVIYLISIYHLEIPY
jgi:hypothetical protein